jgi:hypothetical protein
LALYCELFQSDQMFHKSRSAPRHAQRLCPSDTTVPKAVTHAKPASPWPIAAIVTDVMTMMRFSHHDEAMGIAGGREHCRLSP